MGEVFVVRLGYRVIYLVVTIIVITIIVIFLFFGVSYYKNGEIITNFKNLNDIQDVTLNRNSVLSLDEKWRDTGLQIKDIENLFLNKKCYASETIFLSCMNALMTIAEKEGKEILLDGRVVSQSNNITIGKIDITNRKTDSESQSSDNSNSSSSTSTATSTSTSPIPVSKKFSNMNEKEKLKIWENVFRRQKTSQIPVEAIWLEISRSFTNRNYESLRVAQAFNAYLSVYKDPHTYILPKEYYEKVTAQSQNVMNSYGFIVSKSNNKFIFTRIYSDSLFEKAGIHEGDVLVEVDGLSVSHLTNEELLNLFKGKQRNSFLILQDEKFVQLTLTKEEQVLKSVQLHKLISGNNKSHWHISIFKIAEGVCKQTESLLLKAQQQNVSGIILDLRDNSGGSMDEVLCLAGLFVGDRKVYELKYFKQNTQRETESFFASSKQVYFGPLAVLVNQGTASSAEILVGVLQDYHRGLVIGERTFGKGTFQEGEAWFKNPKILIFQTKGLFTLPSGSSPQLIGIIPDIRINSWDIAEGREEDLYYNPVYNFISSGRGSLQKDSSDKGSFEVAKNTSKNQLKIKNCEDRMVPARMGDPQVGKALAILSCS